MARHSEAVCAFSALGHEHRLAVYRLLVEAGPNGLSAGAIAGRLGIPPSSLTFHTQALVRAGLVRQRRESRLLFYSADFAAMNALVAYLTENCCGGQPQTCAPDDAASTQAENRRRSA
jgi:ArsR family transcriptional regulator, arsenate/arsenite/antimonite-responsive transcriptional repressor